MSIPECGTHVRGSGKDLTIWKLEWTYTDASGAVLLDRAQSDKLQQVLTPVADGGVGIVSVQFPKSLRAWMLHGSIEPATEATQANIRHSTPVDINATAGTMKLFTYAITTDPAESDPEIGSRGRLTLLLERP
jgi:hypothetical protein